MDLLKDIRPTWLEVDLDRLGYNMKNIRKFVDKGVKILAVVKGDAYGHGAVTASKIFLENGADMLGVANLAEAIELRRAGIGSEILVLGYTQDSQLPKVIDYGITQTIYSLDQARILSQAGASKSKEGLVHIKVDTGMSRLGFSRTEESLKDIEEICGLNNIRVEGIFSHLLESDKKDKSIAKKQFKRFMDFLSKLEDRGVNIPIKHISNSGALIDMPEMNLDMVRAGILLYGMYPSDQVKRENIDIKLASAFKTRIAQIRKINKGSFVGYDKGFVSLEPMDICTIPVGYGDGYTMELAGLIRPRINDKAVPVIGNICMDQAMLDIRGVTGLKRGDVVILYDFDNDLIMPDYIVRISRRVPRVYYSSGRVVCVVDYLLRKIIKTGEGV